jgi:hypothetical protein
VINERFVINVSGYGFSAHAIEPDLVQINRRQRPSVLQEVMYGRPYKARVAAYKRHRSCDPKTKAAANCGVLSKI